MCGRYGVFTNPADARGLIEGLGELDGLDELDFTPRYNACPTDENPVVYARHGARRIRNMRWGLVPHWAKDERIGARMINARSETVFQKSAFSRAARERRCLVPADGFYEWRNEGKVKHPVRFTVPDGPFFMAGVWTRKDELYSYSILTCPAVEPVSELHDRMPLILHADDLARWLDPDVTEPDLLTPLFVPFEGLVATPVSRAVNSVKSEGPELWQPLG